MVGTEESRGVLIWRCSVNVFRKNVPLLVSFCNEVSGQETAGKKRLLRKCFPANFAKLLQTLIL